MTEPPLQCPSFIMACMSLPVSQYLSFSSRSIVGCVISINLNKAAGVTLPDHFARRATYFRKRNTVLLPHPLVGEVIANRGLMVKSFTIHVCNTQRAIVWAAWVDRT